jgi:hypothetical protein
MRGSCNGFIEIINISLMMLTMMDLHSSSIDVWFEGFMRVRKRG